MIIIDTALKKLEQEGKPIRVGMIGSGFMARAIARQLLLYSPGIALVAIANRTIEKAVNAVKDSGREAKQVKHASEIPARGWSALGGESAAKTGIVAVTDDAQLLATADAIDVIVEVTGTLEHAATILTAAIDHGKHIVSMNAELDGTVGSVLKKRADAKGVIYTLSDGDQPGIEMNMFRRAKGRGLTPLVCGNIKGLHDPYRTPKTQAAFAAKWGQDAAMVTSFADGTKISYEQACVANATGMTVAKRGMHGFVLPPNTPIEQTVNYFKYKELKQGPGIVDYVVGAVPNGGVFILATTDDPAQKHMLNLYKAGPGPLYCFYTPYHLCHFDTTDSIARAVLFRDATLAAKPAPTVEVITAAKRDLKIGETLEPMGRFMTYGLCENSPAARKENLLPLGLAEGSVLKKAVKKDAVLTFADIEQPKGRLIDRLWKEQFNTGVIARDRNPEAIPNSYGIATSANRRTRDDKTNKL